MNPESGVTLMEAMTVVVILGVLGAVTVPQIGVWTQAHQLRGAAATLYADMTTARLRTIKDKVRYCLRMDGANGQWLLYHVGPNGLNENGGGDDVVLKARRISEFGADIGNGIGHAPGGVTAATLTGPDYASFGGSRVTFNSMGQCNAGFFYLSNSHGGSFAVGALSSGVVRVRQWKGGSIWE